MLKVYIHAGTLDARCLGNQLAILDIAYAKRHHLADYAVAVNADVRDITTISVGEPDFKASALGGKAVGELGIVGVAAAVANAVFHATGKRVRDLPITLDKLV